MFATESSPKTASFLGLNNVSDPLRLGLGWLAIAENINVTDTGAVSKRDGYAAPTAGVFTGVFTTEDYQRMYLVDGGNLRTQEGAVLMAGITPAPMYWTEINREVFFSNGTSAGVIKADNSVDDWRWTIPSTPIVSAASGSLPAGLYQVRCTSSLGDGRETGAGDAASIVLGEGQALNISGITPGDSVYICPANSTVFQFAGTPNGPMVWNSSPDSLGADLTTNLLDPLPLGVDVVQAWRGRMYAAQYMPHANQTVVWFSQPLGFHLFNLNSDYLLIPGRVHMLAPHESALLIGTDSKVLAYDGASQSELANYGVTPGQHWCIDEDDKQTYFWTQRGVCKALPFSNLTASHVSVAPGLQAGGTVVRSGGQKRYLVALHKGGSAFNPYS